MVSTEVQTGEELLDAEVALAKRMEREWMEEKKRLQNELRDVSNFDMGHFGPLWLLVYFAVGIFYILSCLSQ